MKNTRRINKTRRLWRFIKSPQRKDRYVQPEQQCGSIVTSTHERN